MYRPHPGSGLGRLAETPYWAFVWAGGMALARHVEACPHLVAGRRVLDLGAGSGLVGIVAARAGAAHVVALECSRYGRAAIALNAAASGVAIEVLDPDRPLPPIDIVLAGDVFYLPEIAAAMLPVLAAHRDAGRTVLVGDPYRRDLPLAALTHLADYEVADMGDAPGAPLRRAGVFRLSP